MLGKAEDVASAGAHVQHARAGVDRLDERGGEHGAARVDASADAEDEEVGGRLVRGKIGVSTVPTVPSLPSTLNPLQRASRVSASVCVVRMCT